MASDEHPLLRYGDTHEEVLRLRHGLAELGYTNSPVGSTLYDAALAAAVAAFQDSRGLAVDGICGPHTWATLGEAAFSLGDRNLYLRQPMLRGDDVAELQLRLGWMGFDAGRVDGIFGPQTAAAVEEFQHNAGETPDSVCGTGTVAAIQRMSPRVTAATVAAVRERERLRQRPRRLTERYIMVAATAELAPMASELAANLRQSGATVSEAYDGEESELARRANTLEVDVYLGLTPAEEPTCHIAYFSTEGFESAGGKRLAGLLAQRLPAALAIEGAQLQGMRVPILRETRMSAVLCRVGPVPQVLARLSPVARTIEGCLARWAAQPV